MTKLSCVARVTRNNNYPCRTNTRTHTDINVLSRDRFQIPELRRREGERGDRNLWCNTSTDNIRPERDSVSPMLIRTRVWSVRARGNRYLRLTSFFSSRRQSSRLRMFVYRRWIIGSINDRLASCDFIVWRETIIGQFANAWIIHISFSFSLSTFRVTYTKLIE